MANPFDDIADQLLGRRAHPGQRPGPKTPAPLERGVQIEGHDKDGTYYVRLDQVVELLEINGVLPKAAARFKRFLEGRS